MSSSAAPEVIGKCSKGHVVTGTWAERIGGWLTCSCGSRAVGKAMNITIKAEKICDGRCTSAVGPSCSCSCGGRNHASDHKH